MKRLFSTSCLALAVGLAGCNNQANPQANQNPQETTATTQSAQQPYLSPLPDTAPIIKVATTALQPPFSHQDGYGDMAGIDIDVIRAVGEEAGFKVEFYQETWQNLFNSVESGSRDLAISGISYSNDRNARYGLSDSYFTNPSAIMYKDGLQITGLGSLKDKRVAAIEGSKQEEQMQTVGGYRELIPIKSDYLLLEAIIQDKVDAVLQDMPVLQYTASNYPQYQLKITPYESPNDPSSQQVILLAKGNDKLLAQVNEGIAKIKANGKLKEIERKHLGDTTN